MGGDELLQLADQLRLAAGREVGLDARLDGGQTLLLQPRDLGLRERLEGELGERRPAPQRQRLAQSGRRVLGLSGGQRLASVLDELLEALRVELTRAHAQAVAGARRLDRRPRCRAPCAAARRAPARS